MQDIKKWIKKNEALKTKLYKDTVDKWTIGWGRNIEDNGISEDEAQLMFDNDFKRSVKELEQYTWYLTQPENVKLSLINMNFNMGIGRLLGFKKMIHALINKNYAIAAMEALDSKWALQVGDRAKQVALMMRQGF